MDKMFVFEQKIMEKLDSKLVHFEKEMAIIKDKNKEINIIKDGLIKSNDDLRMRVSEQSNELILFKRETKKLKK